MLKPQPASSRDWADNIENIGNCMTRLRVEVKDASVVKDKEWFAPTGAAGLVVKGNNIQIIYGPVISKKRSIVEKALGREE
jgi:phosphotransferase system IIB component